MLTLFLSLLLVGIASSEDCGIEYRIPNQWNAGWQGEFSIPIAKATRNWKLTIKFLQPFTEINVWDGTVKKNADNTKVTVKSFDWSSEQTADSTYKLGFVVYHNMDEVIKIKKMSLKVCWADGGCTTCNIKKKPVVDPTDEPKPDPTEPKPDPTEPKPDPTDPKPDPTDEPKPDPTEPKPDPTDEPKPDPTEPKPDPTEPKPDPTESPDGCDESKYSEAMRLSLLFYEAQRSGKLPANNRVPWRKDSALDDLIVGGYYDAGDYVKFGFPMASMTTMAAWGAVDFEAGFKKACQWEHIKSMLKWSTDYFMEAHTDTNEFVGQIGDGDIDHAWWGRPEDMPADMSRPAAKITTSKPGTELAAETAAALAAASMVFREEQDAYADSCVEHAKELYQFADEYRGNYASSIEDAAKFYNSYSGYMDELAWAAVWLYRATGDASYLAKAKSISLNVAGEISWDNKNSAAIILLAAETKEATYTSKAEQFCNQMFEGTSTTNDGLVFIQQWGSLRHASNVAFACIYAESAGVLTNSYKAKAKRQIDYILGDNSRSFSYLIGYGDSYPLRPHHASSSCPSTGSCGWNEYNSADPNPHVLLGALVGGPKSANDNDYQDVRSDYICNEVTTDYNAGFQSAVAALVDMGES